MNFGVFSLFLNVTQFSSGKFFLHHVLVLCVHYSVDRKDIIDTTVSMVDVDTPSILALNVWRCPVFGGCKAQQPKR